MKDCYNKSACSTAISVKKNCFFGCCFNPFFLLTLSKKKKKKGYTVCSLPAFRFLLDRNQTIQYLILVYCEILVYLLHFNVLICLFRTIISCPGASVAYVIRFSVLRCCTLPQQHTCCWNNYEDLWTCLCVVHCSQHLFLVRVTF